MTKMEDKVPEVIINKDDASKDGTKITYDFDIVMEYIGQMGRYQCFLAFYSLYLVIPIGMHAVSSVFLLGVPGHRCYIEAIDGADAAYPSISEEYVLNISTPMDSESYDGCKMNDYNYTDCFNEKNRFCLSEKSQLSTVPCQRYKYSNGEFSNSAVSEWDLVCDRLILGTTSNALFFVGGTIGSIFVGSISDNFGRRVVLLIGFLLTIVSGIICAFSSSLALFTAMRFIIALATNATFPVGFVYVMEIIGEKWSVRIGAVYNTFYAIGYTLLSPMGYIWQDWRSLMIAMTLISVPLVLMWFLMPESPRWLFAKGRLTEGKNASLLIAKRNGLAVSDDIWVKSLQQRNHVENQQYYSVMTLFQKPGIRLVTIIMVFCWFVAALAYFGLSLNVGAVAGDVYTNNALSGFAEIIAGPVGMVAIKRFGRRNPTCITFLIAAIMCISSSLVAHYIPDLGILATSLALIGKFAISMTFACLFVYTSELFPTVVRASAVSICISCALAASVITPFVLFLQNYFSWLPGIIFGTTTLLAGLACMRLRETLDLKMMTTLSEAELFYKGLKS